MLEIGSLVDGKYKILNKVGQGGMSVVYLAMNEKANKQWAIKEVRKDGIKDFEVVKQGLIVETDMLKRLSHPYLPSIIDVIEDENTFLIVMDFFKDFPRNLKRNIHGPTNDGEQCKYFVQLHSVSPLSRLRQGEPETISFSRPPDACRRELDHRLCRQHLDTAFRGGVFSLTHSSTDYNYNSCARMLF